MNCSKASPGPRGGKRRHICWGRPVTRRRARTGRGDQDVLVTSPHAALAPVSDTAGRASGWREPATLCCSGRDRPRSHPSTCPLRPHPPCWPPGQPPFPSATPPGAGCVQPPQVWRSHFRFQKPPSGRSAEQTPRFQRRPGRGALPSLRDPHLHQCLPWGPWFGSRSGSTRSPQAGRGREPGRPATHRPRRQCPRLPLSAAAGPAEPQTGSLFLRVTPLRGAWALHGALVFSWEL